MSDSYSEYVKLEAAAADHRRMLRELGKLIAKYNDLAASVDNVRPDEVLADLKAAVNG